MAGILCLPLTSIHSRRNCVCLFAAYLRSVRLHHLCHRCDKNRGRQCVYEPRVMRKKRPRMSTRCPLAIACELQVGRRQAIGLQALRSTVAFSTDHHVWYADITPCVSHSRHTHTVRYRNIQELSYCRGWPTDFVYIGVA